MTRAVEILRRGGLVAFPTETVYGLGADATNAAAVRRIFEVKGRPPTNPLIVHVADAAVARRYAASWPATAQALAERFWPGPLTLVLPRSPAIAREVTAGRETVGLRVPNHPLALELLRAFDGPVAAPSANRSNRVSPTTAGHVRKELGDAVDLILDGGPCDVGIESTVLDLSAPRPTILRPGGVTREQIEAVVGLVEVFSGHVGATIAAASPGQHEVHYSPSTPAFRFSAGQAEAVAAWCRANADAKAEILCVERSRAIDAIRVGLSFRHHLFEMPGAAEAYARGLYAALHAADAGGAKRIWIEVPEGGPEWDAVRDRLSRATRPISP